MGFDEDLKQIRKAMQSANCENSTIRAWLKQYDKVKKQTMLTKEKYALAHQSIVEIQDNAKQIERMLVNTEDWTTEEVKVLQMIAKNLKKLQGSYEHEFLVSSQNQEYRLTYNTLIELGSKFSGKEENKLIFQSEAENLIALNKEVLGHTTPAFVHLGFYEVNRSAEDLSDLPYQEKMRKITSLYQNDFVKPIRKQLITAIEYADHLEEAGDLDSGWKSGRLRDTFGVLLNKSGESKSPEERADMLLDQLGTEF